MTTSCLFSDFVVVGALRWSGRGSVCIPAGGVITAADLDSWICACGALEEAIGLGFAVLMLVVGWCSGAGSRPAAT